MDGSISNKREKKEESIDYIMEIDKGYISDSIFFESLPYITEQMKHSVCKILKTNGNSGTGFLCKIPYPNPSNLLPVLITCYHVLDEDDIKIGKKIEMKFNNDATTKSILIDKERKVYVS